MREWGVEQADKYDARLEKAANNIAKHPSLGRQCEEIKPGYRRFEVGRHIIFYRVRKADVLIVRILHDRMDANRINST